jgi:hypothetical protein
MSTSHASAPAWLFSFVDLAFLLLIAMTQLSSFDEERVELAELVLPSLQRSAGEPLDPEAAAGWQLRVHPVVDGEPSYELWSSESGEEEGARLELASLQVALISLASGGKPRPLVAPHPDSRSEDLLRALDLVDELWPSRRRALVERGQAAP